MTYRTVQAEPLQSKFNGKWGCTFRMMLEFNGEEHVTGALETSQIWDSPEEAVAAGNRAIELLEATGKWPNLCERW